MGTTGLRLAVLIKRRSASLVEVMLALAELLAGLLSVSGIETVAVLLNAPTVVAVATSVIAGILVKLPPV